MKIIAHRGASSLHLENTIASIDAAATYKPDFIEFDVQPTKDGHLVLMHDPSLSRLSGERRLIANLNLSELQAVKLNDGSTIPTLQQALSACQSVPAMIEGKGEKWAQLLADAVEKHTGPKPSVVSDNVKELSLFTKICPDIDTFIIRRHMPLLALRTARRNNFTGITMLYWWINPYIYWRTKKSNKTITAYTLNPAFVPVFHWLYPNVAIATNHPQLYASHRNDTPRA